ncbi:hypothetical protein GR328_01925 [Microvirga makkahensis]|uniref:Uncharacterized protein n=1 Tax=Microvirga makkahensis TaxID=1128670 RepID=A0A7X3SMP7_9HYPH|nr:hypothetical protein [Microvirga makkahensis]
MAHGSARDVLILGGGTLKEVLKHPVEHAPLWKSTR